MGKYDKKAKKTRKFRWWYIPVSLIALMLVAVIGLTGFLMTMLPARNIIAFTSNFQVALADSVKNFALSG